MDSNPEYADTLLYFHGSFDDLVKRLRKPAVIETSKEMIETIQQIITSLKLAAPAAPGTQELERQSLNVRVVLAAFMTAFHPTFVFEVVDVAETQLVASSTNFLLDLEAIANYLKANTTINADVTNNFHVCRRRVIHNLAAPAPSGPLRKTADNIVNGIRENAHY